MTEKQIDKLDANIGIQGRCIGGAVCFGLWQHNINAAIAFYFLLLTLERPA